MSHLLDIRLLKGFTTQGLRILKDILTEHRFYLEEGNAFEYWEDVEVTTHATPNTEFLVALTKLNRTPQKYIITKKDKAVDVYSGDTINSLNKLYLKATVASATITLKVVG